MYQNIFLNIYKKNFGIFFENESRTQSLKLYRNSENGLRISQKSSRRDHSLERRAWTSLSRKRRGCVHAYVRTCGYTWNAFLDVTRRKKYVPTARRQPRHWPARERLVTYIHMRAYYANTCTIWCFNSVKRHTLLSFISLRGYRCASKQFATVSTTEFRNAH